MRNMSFTMTADQVRQQTKSVTRRFGWWHLRPGDFVQPVRKTLGLRKGEKVEKLGPPIRIISVRRERLDAISPNDVIREGYPSWTPERFVNMLCQHYRIAPDTMCNRIEFEYAGVSDDA